MFKFVRIDDEKHCEVPLIDGKQVIGRGQISECEDKRISRSHAEIETTVDTVTIKALHTNPCFYVKNNMADAQIIHQNCSVNGTHGDKVGFLPDKYWYIIRNTNISDEGPVDINETHPITTLIQRCKDLLETNKKCNVDESSENKLALNDRTENSNSNEPNACLEVPGSPSLLSTYNDRASPQPDQQNEQSSQSPGKRCLIKQEPDSPMGVKKIKKEEDAETDEPKCSTEEAGSCGSSAAANDDSTSPKNEKRPGRERCMYGTTCYRKNPQHKAQFSHPGDADWGAGARARCPWGYACVRSDPRHWRDHSHPYGMQPPPAGRRKKRVKKTTRKDSPLEELIVTGKRARKTVQRETWSGSESEQEDPYGTDDSDDWNPPSDVSESQDYSQLID